MEPEYLHHGFWRIAAMMRADPWWSTPPICYDDSCGRVYRQGFRIDGNQAEGEINAR
jgi:hypothetical protein